jgi:hypothetical protein
LFLSIERVERVFGEERKEKLNHIPIRGKKKNLRFNKFVFLVRSSMDVV